jgi:hypothetical protein
MYGKFYIGSVLSDAFPTQNGLKQGDDSEGRPQKSGGTGTEWDAVASGLCC